MNEISLEVKLFLSSILWGIELFLAYDAIRVLRRVITHGKVLVWIEDIFFWVLSGCVIFSMMYKMNEGRIRSFAIVGMILGMVLYHSTVSEFLVVKLSLGIKKIIAVFLKIVRWIMRPLHFMSRRFLWFIRFIEKLIKRPLRVGIKALKNIVKTVKIGVTKK